VAAYDVIVIGVGGMGSATCFHLAARGKRVLGLEQSDIPHQLGSSHGVNRIIRLAYAEHPSYVPLLRRAYELWRELEHRTGERLLVVTGGIDAGPEGCGLVTGSVRSCHEHAIPHEVLTAAETARRFPGYRLARGMVSVYQADAGFVSAERSVVAHANAALAHGAEIHGRERVLEWRATRGGVRVRTDRGRYEAERLVLTAGAWSGKVAGALVRVARPERQVMLWTQPRRPERFRVGAFPVFNMEVPEGRFYGFPVHGIPGFKIGKYHHRQQQVDPDTIDRDCDARDEAAVREGITRYFPDADGPTLSMAACMFTNTPDEHFILDRHPDSPAVSIAAGFSGHGFKFSSVVGEIMADLATTGRTRWDLDLFRLARPALAAPPRPKR
jgi:sarcosine oxidase